MTSSQIFQDSVEMLSSLDFSDSSVKLAFIGISFLFWTTLYLTSGITSRLLRSYNKLKVKEKVFWNMTLVRGVYGFFATFIGIWTLFFSTAHTQDVVHGRSLVNDVTVLVSLGFFIFESVMVTGTDMFYGGFQILLNVHHWLGLLGFAFAAYTQTGHFFSCGTLILEMSTPFSALCWVLLKMGHGGTPFWRCNQMVLLHTFHLRNVCECYVLWISYLHWNRISTQMPGLVFWHLYPSLLLVTLVMTPYWTYRKTVQFGTASDFNFVETRSNGHVKKAN